jgi:hypothetical protein
MASGFARGQANALHVYDQGAGFPGAYLIGI